MEQLSILLKLASYEAHLAIPDSLSRWKISVASAALNAQHL